MIAAYQDEDIQPATSRWRAHRWPEVGAFLFFLASVAFYLQSTRQPTEWEIERATETPRMYYFGGSGNLMVTAFSPDTAIWKDIPRAKVAVGQEFIFMGSFCKEIAPLHAAVYDQNDITRIRDSFGLFNKQTSRVPGPDDSVYVLDRPIPDGGFWPLRYVKPGERIHFQGRIYITRAGSNPNTMMLRDTGEIVTTLPTIPPQEAPDEDQRRRNRNLRSV